MGIRQGCFELANCGTLFLDEIGEMPTALQPKLLGPAFGEAPEDLSYRISTYCDSFKAGKACHFIPGDALMFATQQFVNLCECRSARASRHRQPQCLE